MGLCLVLAWHLCLHNVSRSFFAILCHVVEMKHLTLWYVTIWFCSPKVDSSHCQVREG